MNFNQPNIPQSRDSSRQCSKNKEGCSLKLNEDDIQLYEYGAHFPYQTVYLKLENYLSSTTSLNTCENYTRKKKANNIFNISIYDKSRNINLNNNIRQNNIHFNNQKKGITLLLFNKSNVTMQNINPMNNNNDKNNNINTNKDKHNVPRRKGAINHNHQEQRSNNYNQPKAKIKSIIHQKEVIGKKSERIANSTSHPKKNILNDKMKKEETAPSKEKSSKSNPVPYKRNINTNGAQAFVNIQINDNISNIRKVKENNLIKKQMNITKQKTHNNSNQYSISSKDKDNKPKPHSANAKIKSNNCTNRNSNNNVILSTAKNKFKSIETKPLLNYQKKNGNDITNTNNKEDKSRNTDNQNSNEKSEEKSKEKETKIKNSKQSMTFNNAEQQIQSKQQENKFNIHKEENSKKPHSSEKPVVIPHMKDVKFININFKKQPEQYYSISRKHHAEVKVNLTTNQNSPSVSKGKMISHNITNINVEKPSKKINPITKYSSRNIGSNKQSIKSTTFKPVLTSKRITNEKEKYIKKLIISNQENSNSEIKMSHIITTSNHSPRNHNQQLNNNNKAIVDLNDKNRTKSNSISAKDSKSHVKSITTKQSFIQCSNGFTGIKKGHYEATKKKK